MEYKTADTSTLDGLRYAERLRRDGWIVYSVGLFLIRFYRKES
jgi:hypothetical protein